MENPDHDSTQHDNLESQDFTRQQPTLYSQEEELRLQAEERRLATARRNIIIGKIIYSIYLCLSALEMLLAFRFILRLTGANSQNQFAAVIYGFSEPFVAPFSTLFISPTFGGGANIFDINLIFAMIVYALLGFLAVKIVRTFAD